MTMQVAVSTAVRSRIKDRLFIAKVKFSKNFRISIPSREDGRLIPFLGTILFHFSLMVKDGSVHHLWNIFCRSGYFYIPQVIFSSRGLFGNDGHTSI